MYVRVFQVMFFCFTLFGFGSFTQAFDSSESITRLDVAIEIQEDRSIFVEEYILYNFGDNQKHGIIRSIPEGKIPGSLKRLQVEDIRVFDENQNRQPFETMQGGNFVDIKIGDPDIYITGEKVYVVKYRVENAIGLFQDFDELYWNSIGHDWEVPIYQVRSSILIPENLQASEVTPQVFCGYFQEVKTCADVFVQNTYRGTEIIFETYPEYKLGEYTGMTNVVSFPKNIVRDFSKFEKFIIYVIPVLKFIIPVFIVWFFQRKNINLLIKRYKYFRNNPIIAEYESGDLDILSSSVILNANVTNSAIIGHIFSLVIGGYLTLQGKDEKGLYVITKTNKSLDGLSEWDRGIIEQVTTKDYDTQKNENWLSLFGLTLKIISVLKQRDILFQHKKTFSSLHNETSMLKTKKGLWRFYLFLAVNPGVFIWFLAGNTIGFIFSATMVLFAVFTIVYSNTRPYLSEYGFELERKILGIKKYILIAEKEKILFHSDPKNNLLFFERLLPFAILFKLEKKWVREFEKIGIAQPLWIQNVDFDNYRLLTSITVTQTLFQQTIDTYSRVSSVDSGLSSSFSSSSSGSSSGSSGGGGGGGGGSSW